MPGKECGKETIILEFGLTSLEPFTLNVISCKLYLQPENISANLRNYRKAFPKVWSMEHQS